MAKRTITMKKNNFLKSMIIIYNLSTFLHIILDVYIFRLKLFIIVKDAIEKERVSASASPVL